MGKFVGIWNIKEKSRRGKEFSFFFEKRNLVVFWFMWGVGKNSVKNSLGNLNKGESDILFGWIIGIY